MIRFAVLKKSSSFRGVVPAVRSLSILSSTNVSSDGRSLSTNDFQSVRRRELQRFQNFPSRTNNNTAVAAMFVRQFAKKSGKSRQNDDDDDEDDDDDNDGRSNAAATAGGFDVKSMEKEMNEVAQRFAKDLTGLRGNRASPDILHKVVIKKNDGSVVPILKLAQITVKDPKTLLVSVFDEANVGSVQNAITNANLGLSPSTLGASSLIVSIPKMSQEYREKLQKMINQMEEDAKQRVRRIRGDAVKHVKKVITGKDDVRRAETNIQNSTETFNKKLIAMAQEKLKEISTN